MSRLYSSTNRIRFTDIPDKYAIPRQYKGKVSDVHSNVVVYVVSNFSNTKKYRQKIVNALNYLTYCIIQGEVPSFDWVSSRPFDTLPDNINFDEIEKGLGDYALSDEAIEWDVKVSDRLVDNVESDTPNKLPDTVSKTISPESSKKNIPVESKPVSTSTTVVNRPLKSVKAAKNNIVTQQLNSSKLTPKEDLYIQPPKYPRFDISKVWLKQQSGNDTLVIYTTLPEVPTKQNEISVTTDLNRLTDSELMSLYPKQLIRTRSTGMYEKVPGLTYDEDLGVIIPIEGFTDEQVIDNIIQYPHLYKLKKYDANGTPVNFYKSVEIDGELIPIEEAWDTLPEAKLMPKDSEFAKEYTVRRYLLEESIGIEHKFKLVGALDPFLTIFMTPADYIRRGYQDTLEIVKQCVRSRVRYKQTRNPILRRLGKQNV